MNSVKITTILFVMTCFLQISLEASNKEQQTNTAINSKIDSINVLIASSMKAGDKVESMRLMKEKGEMLHSQGFYESVILTLDNAIQLSDDGRDTMKYPAMRELYMNCLNIKSGSLSYLSRYEDAVNCCIKMDKYNKRRDPLYTSKFLNSMGTAFSTSGKYEQAVEYYRRAFVMTKRVENESDRNFQLFIIQGNLGGVFAYKSDFDSAQLYLMEAQKLAIVMQDKKREVVALHLFGFLNIEAGKPQLAIGYYEEAYKLAVENRMDYIIPFIKLNIANYYIQVKDYERALGATMEALSLAKESKLKKVESSILKTLSTIYKDKKDFERAFYYLEQSNNLKDSIFSLQNEGQVMKQKQNFDIYQVEVEKEILNKNLEISDGKRIITNLIALFVIIVFVGIFIWFSYQLYLQHKINRQICQQHDDDVRALKDENRAFEGEIVKKDKDISRYTLLMTKMNETGFIMLSKLKILRSYLPARSMGYGVIKEIEDIIYGFKFDENNELDDLHRHFDNVSSEFYYKLECRYPDLTSGEKKMCALMSLGLSTKELLSITGKTQSAIDNIKLRIRRKMNIDSSVNLSNFLSQI